MSDVAAAVHGGNLAEIARRYGIHADRLLDFSANVNPLGPPRSLVRAFERAARDRDGLSRYPDDGHAGLTQALARRLQVDPAAIVVANGAAALLDAAVRVRRLSRCLLPVPAFSEDRRALDAAQVPVATFALPRDAGFRLSSSSALDAMRRAGCDALLVTNPHNPSGALASRADVEQLVAATRECGALAIVDEAFVDFVPDASIAAVAARESSTIVIRSLTKFFAVPALRVGYAVCEPNLARRLRAILPSWPVSSVAARALVPAIADAAYARRTLSFNLRERERLARQLRRRGFEVTDSAANFLLVGLPPGAPSASAVTETLIVRDRIVVRDCSSYCGLEDGRYVRVAVRSRRDGVRLAAALSEAIRRH